MKKIILFCFLTLSFNLALCQSLSFQNAISFGGTGNENIQSVESDNAGFVYLTGTFEGTVDFNPGPITTNLTSNGGTDIFILKLDNANNLIWAKSIGGTGNDFSVKITLNPAGEVYIAGVFTNLVDLNPGSGTQNASAVGLQDFFLLKLTNAGNFIWAQTFGGSDYDVVYDLVLDENNFPVLFGTYFGTVDFNPGAGYNAHTATGNKDAFLVKLDASGQYVWSKSFGGPGIDLAQAIDIDPLGNIYATGGFNNIVDFDPGAGTFDLSSNGNFDMYVLKLKANGNFAWAGSVGGGTTDWGQSISVKNNVLMATALFTDVIDANIGLGVQYISSMGGIDGLILKLDTAGNFVWARQIGGTGSDYSKVKIDTAGNYICTGTFSSVCDVDPGVNILNFTPNGSGLDVYIDILDPSGNLIDAKQLGSASDESVNGVFVSSNNTVYMCGSFQDVVDFNLGSGVNNLSSAGINDGFLSVYSFCNSTYASFSASGCGSYVWPLNGTNYSSSGTYQHIIPNTLGCDSIISLNLTINTPFNNTTSATSCHSYLWSANNLIYTLSGLYGLTFTDVNGCDSTLNLNLTINNADTTVTAGPLQLMAASALPATYQWLDCNAGNTAIPGQTANTFVPVQNGNYALAITQNGCTDTSNCYSINVVSVSSSPARSIFSITPNPACDNLIITVPFAFVPVIFTDISGKVVKQIFSPSSQNVHADVSDLNPGLYFVKCENLVLTLIKTD